jgi:hypothetical protein
LESVKGEAETAKAALQEKIVAERVIARKQVLASKNYPQDMIEDEMDTITNASDEDFNKFVVKFEALASKLKPATQVQASSNANNTTVVASLTQTNNDQNSNGSLYFSE